MAKTIIAAAIGECVHVAGISRYLRLAEEAGWKTVFLGPAVPIEKVLEVAVKSDAQIVGVSYRLTPENAEHLAARFAEEASVLKERGVRFYFAGTPPVAERVRRLGFFDAVFEGGETLEQVQYSLREEADPAHPAPQYPKTLLDRITWKKPAPLLRHHFGLPEMEKTIEGIREIAESGLIDVISLGIDQDAQENFYHQERQDPRSRGAGGVPVRSEEDYRRLYEAAQTGNYPLLRTYSGTDDFLRLAEMTQRTIHNAWCAIPLFWFNQMDGRGPWDLQGSIREHQKVMAWHGQRGIAVELNEPHHWGMRDAPDVIFAVSAYLSAHNAKAFGVKTYIAQLMFNSPAELSGAMDLAKMLAVLDLIEPMRDEQFEILTQTRTGLLSFPVDEDAARAHLAVETMHQLALHPQILHIVGHTEADHAATAWDVKSAARMVRRVIETYLAGTSQPGYDPAVTARREELVGECRVLLEAIRRLGKNSADPFTDVEVLSQAVSQGLLDAPQLQNNAYARGTIRTAIRAGKCVAVDAEGRELSEEERIAGLERTGK